LADGLKCPQLILRAKEDEKNLADNGALFNILKGKVDKIIYH